MVLVSFVLLGCSTRRALLRSLIHYEPPMNLPIEADIIGRVYLVDSIKMNLTIVNTSDVGVDLDSTTIVRLTREDPKDMIIMYDDVNRLFYDCFPFRGATNIAPGDTCRVVFSVFANPSFFYGGSNKVRVELGKCALIHSEFSPIIQHQYGETDVVEIYCR